MLERLRKPVCARICASMLFLGIVVAWAAPARAARAWEVERQKVASILATADAQRVTAALAEASLKAATPEAFASEVVRVLADQPEADPVSPATDALLKLLFGRILQAMALGRTLPGVVVAPSVSDGPVPQVAVTAAPSQAESRVPAPAVFARLEYVPAPSVDRPEIQAQGP